MNIPRAIKASRLARGLTQQELANSADVSSSYLSLIESGKKEPSLPLLRDLAAAIGISFDALMLVAIDFREIAGERDQLSALFGEMLMTLVGQDER